MSFGGGLIFKPLKSTIKEFKAALHAKGLLPGPFAVEGGEGGYRLGKPTQVGDKCRDELGKWTPARPGFGEQALKGFFRVVVGQPCCATGVCEQTC